MVMDSRAMDMAAMATMTTLVITAMGVATITVSDKSPQGEKQNERNFIFFGPPCYKEELSPFFLLSSRPGQYKLWENSKTWRPPE